MYFLKHLRDFDQKAKPGCRFETDASVSISTHQTPSGYRQQIVGTAKDQFKEIVSGTFTHNLISFGRSRG